MAIDSQQRFLAFRYRVRLGADRQLLAISDVINVCLDESDRKYDGSGGVRKIQVINLAVVRVDKVFLALLA